MKTLTRIVAIVLFVALPSSAFAQAGTSRSEFDGWLKSTEHQGDLPIGTKITMSNWQQYKEFMPFGMIVFFQGQYYWKMPADLEMEIGPSHEEANLPKSWVQATEKYGSQTSVEVLPNGHYVLKNYYGGTPFPNPQEPYKGWKILANAFWGYTPAIINQNPQNNNWGTVWAQDRFGNISASSLDYVYRMSDYITDPGFQHTYNYAPGTWYTEWIMQETPEQVRYTAVIDLFFTEAKRKILGGNAARLYGIKFDAGTAKLPE
jgi:Protein of unknown function (DUF1329)